MRPRVLQLFKALGKAKGTAVILILLLALISLTVLRRNSPLYEISRLLGGRSYARILEKPDAAQLFVTARFMARLTNGPDAETYEKVEPGIPLPPAAIQRISDIFVEAAPAFSQIPLWAQTAPPIILRLRRGHKSMDLEFSDDLRAVNVTINGASRTCLDIEPAQRALERALEPFLPKRTDFLHSN